MKQDEACVFVFALALGFFLKIDCPRGIDQAKERALVERDKHKAMDKAGRTWFDTPIFLEAQRRKAT